MKHPFPVLIFFLLMAILMAGCTQNVPTPIPVPTAVPEPVATMQEAPVAPAPTGNETPVPLTTSQPAPEMTMIIPTPLPTENVTEQVKPNVTQDKNIIFRDRMLLTLDNLQGAKEGILIMYKAGDIVRVKTQADELTLSIQKSGRFTDTPDKLKYARMNYLEYADQASQFAQSFSDGAARWLANDKASANSYFEGGIMASDRADIADKRIRVFLKDQVRQAQTNQTML